MELIRFERAEDFYARAESFLLEREAEHNLILGICASIIHGQEYREQLPYLATLEQNGAVVGAAVMTPPHNLILSHMPIEALPIIARDVRALYGTIPGVNGPSALSLAFAQQWQALTGQPYYLGMAQRIYQLTKVRLPMGVPGQLRRASEADRELLLAWLTGFYRDAMGEPGDPAPSVERFLSSETRGLYLWEDGRPVSMAGYTGPTKNGIRVGAVYTPPENRRRGYASACVAAVSQLLLDQGRRFCFLYTDLSNPTSNHIYQAVGYEPVCDVDL
ncbi:MAG: GNAT family N-acetyltransferase, partial [Anaerolineae bacterium]